MNRIPLNGKQLTLVVIGAIASLTLGWGACGNTPGNPQDPKPKNNAKTKKTASIDTNRKDSAQAKNNAKTQVGSAGQIITYTKTVIANGKHLDSIRRAYRKVDTVQNIAYRAFITVNRKDLHYFRVGDTVIIPSMLSPNLTDYSVFPAEYHAVDSLPKIIIVSNAWQSYACYEYGKLVRFAACNTGEERKATFPGKYALNWRHILRRSSLNSSWILPYTWNFHLHAGSAFHQFDMPGRPVSHSCIRQFRDDARWLFYWGEGAKRDTIKRRYIPFSGTPVIILDMFDFSRKKGGPWWDITDNTFKITLPEDPMNTEEAWIPISQVPQSARGGLPNKERYIAAEDTLRVRGIIRDGVKLRASIQYSRKKKPAAAGATPAPAIQSKPSN
ncbi:MAG: L,D-transpeptidase [Ignavibacteria bacterium]|jgi:lipoprotein-anchoring transpeptidase ErfK/SrfK